MNECLFCVGFISLFQGKGGVFKGILGQSTKTVKEGTVSQVCLIRPELTTKGAQLKGELCCF